MPLEREQTHDGPSTVHDNLPAGIAWAIVGASVLIILYSTLKQFDFDFRPLSLRQYVAAFVFVPSSLLDFPRNILLFMPFGFGLFALLSSFGWRDKRIWLAVGITGLLLTWTVESLQIFLPERSPSVSDMVSNTLGALAGGGAYRIWQERTAVTQRLHEALHSRRTVILMLLLYSALLVLIAFLLGRTTQFSQWQLDYPLLVGNERGGKRPWLGTVTDVAIFDRALTDQEVQNLLDSADPISILGDPSLLAYYPLSGEAPLDDQTGQAPSLVWHPEQTDSAGYELDGQHWLKSVTAVSELSQKLQKGSHVSVRLTAAPAATDQTGPARIVSISGSVLRRNMTIGQDGSDLVLRLNTYVGGKNGDAMEMHFPGRFTDTSSQTIVVTFDGVHARVYSSASAQPQSVELLPGPVFYRHLNPYAASYWKIAAAPMSQWLFRLLYYLLLFLPLGAILTAARGSTWTLSARAAFWLWALVAVPLLTEAALVYTSGQSPRPLNMLIAAACVTAGALVLGPFLARAWHSWRVTHS